MQCVKMVSPHSGSQGLYATCYINLSDVRFQMAFGWLPPTVCFQAFPSHSCGDIAYKLPCYVVNIDWLSAVTIYCQDTFSVTCVYYRGQIYLHMS